MNRPIFCVLLIAFTHAMIPYASELRAEIPWQRSPESVFAKAQQTGRPILVFVTAEWCHYCKKMKRETWQDPRVDQAVSQGFETLVLDGDRDKAVVNKLELRGYPATLVYTPDGRFIEQKGGYMPAGTTLAWLSSIKR